MTMIVKNWDQLDSVESWFHGPPATKGRSSMYPVQAPLGCTKIEPLEKFCLFDLFKKFW